MHCQLERTGQGISEPLQEFLTLKIFILAKGIIAYCIEKLIEDKLAKPKRVNNRSC
jgi:hypothetical protein